MEATDIEIENLENKIKMFELNIAIENNNIEKVKIILAEPRVDPSAGHIIICIGQDMEQFAQLTK